MNISAQIRKDLDDIYDRLQALEKKLSSDEPTTVGRSVTILGESVVVTLSFSSQNQTIDTLIAANIKFMEESINLLPLFQRRPSMLDKLNLSEVKQ